MPSTARVTALVRGRVQGVGFRYWVREQAWRLGLAGSATNLPDGRVEVVAEGPRDAVTALVTSLREGDTPGAVIDVIESWDDPRGESAFRVR